MIHPIISQMGNRGLERDRLVQGHPERWTELGREARLLQLWLPFPAQHPHSRWTVVRTCRGVWGLKALEAGRELWGGHALPPQAGEVKVEQQQPFCGQEPGAQLPARSREAGRAPQHSPPLLLRILELQGWESLEVLFRPQTLQETISKLSQ